MLFPFGDLSSVVLLIFLTGGSPISLGTPPKPEDPAIAAVAPAKCVFYASWAGRATPDSKSDNQTEQLLAEPEIVRLNEALDRYLEKAWGEFAVPLAENESEKKLYRALFAFGRKVFDEPTAIFIEKVDAANEHWPVDVGIVTRVGDRADKTKETLVDLLTRATDAGEIELQPLERGGLSGHRIKLKGIPTPVACGIKGQYLLVAVGNANIEDMARRLEGKPPAWLSQLKKQLPIARPATTTYINVTGAIDAAAALLEKTAAKQADGEKKDAVQPKDRLAKIVRALGFDNVEYIAEIGGLDGEGFATKALIAIDGPPRGLLQLVPDRPLRPEDLQPIPRDATYALAMRFDAQRAIDIVTTVATQVREATGDAPAAGDTDLFGGLLQIDMRRQLLQSIGDTWCLYSSPSEGGFIITGLTFVAPLRNSSQFSSGVMRLVTGLGQAVGGEAAAPVQRTTLNGRDLFWTAGWPFAWSMTDREFVAALAPQHVKAFLSRKADYRSLATVPQVAQQFSESSRPVILGCSDMPKLFELAYPFISMSVAGMGMNGIEGFDVSLLPSAPSIGWHLRPATLVVERVPTGIQIVNRGVLPKPGLAFTCAVAAVCLWQQASHSPFGAGVELMEPPMPPSEAAPQLVPPESQ